MTRAFAKGRPPPCRILTYTPAGLSQSRSPAVSDRHVPYPRKTPGCFLKLFRVFAGVVLVDALNWGVQGERRHGMAVFTENRHAKPGNAFAEFLPGGGISAIPNGYEVLA